MMEYADIIKDNCENHSSAAWWPKFAFHYTDVTNAVSILSTGFLYSRVNTKKMNLMKNDNASRQVIDMTKTEAAANVRFYFRPLTPTQYYNEGFKHAELRYDNDENANVPVPVFFLFDLEKLLSMPETKFSEFAQSGYGSPMCSEIEDFQKLDFDKIYSSGYVEEHEQIKYRHAELLYPNSFAIDSCIRAVLCRNNMERTTLLNLLKESNKKAFYKYTRNPIIKVCREDMFEKNGLFVTECSYHDGKVSISFSETYAMRKYTNSLMAKNVVDALDPVKARAEFEWVGSKGVFYRSNTEFELDYINTSSVVFNNLPKFKEAKKILVKLFLEDKLMCCAEQPLAEIELI